MQNGSQHTRRMSTATDSCTHLGAAGATPAYKESNMEIQRNNDERYGGIQRLATKLTNMQLAQTVRGPITLTVALQPDLEVHSYRFSTTEGDLFSVHSSIPLGVGQAVVNLRSERGTTTFDLACTAGMINAERSSQHMFRLTAHPPDVDQDHEDYWEALVHI